MNLLSLNLIYWIQNVNIIPKMQLFGFHKDFMIIKPKHDIIPDFELYNGNLQCLSNFEPDLDLVDFNFCSLI